MNSIGMVFHCGREIELWATHRTWKRLLPLAFAWKARKKEVEKLWCDKFWQVFLTLFLWFWISANRRKQDCFLWKNMRQRKPRNWKNSSSMLWSPQKYLFYVEQYYHVPLCYPYTLKCSALNINVGKKLPFWTRDHSYMMYVSRVDNIFDPSTHW